MLRLFSKVFKPFEHSVTVSGRQYGVQARVMINAVRNDKSNANVKREPSEGIDHYDKYLVQKVETPNTIHVNIEEVDKDIQSMFVENYIETLVKHIGDNEIHRIRFNYINEDVFRCQLNMRIRKLGYISYFKRYNDDRGIAEFYLKKKGWYDVDSKRIGSFNRMAYTKSRKTDILNLVM